jgi:riboflavin kinase/FMN adenylyltransferase
MKIYHDIPENRDLFKNAVVTIGSFDGVHLGHLKILSIMRETALRTGGDPVVITFLIHPRKILNPEYHLEVLTSNEEKIRLIYAAGIPNIILLNFTKETSQMHAGEFFNEVLIKKIDSQHIVIGYDHAFGKNREGTIEYIESLAKTSGVTVTRVGEEDFSGKPVSSTWIRNEIKSGNVDFAAELLGRKYTLEGTVTSGEGIGKTLGFPTANVLPDEADKLIPGDGVYCVSVEVDGNGKKYNGMLNIGNRPTFKNLKRSIEVNIFNFNENIYGNKIIVAFYKKIRDEIKFENVQALVNQIKEDKKLAEKYFNEIKI